MSQPGYIPGDFWRICDVCGIRYRASQTRMRWDRLMVCEKDWEPRHPQDNVRARPDRMAVPNPRPDAVDVFVTSATMVSDDGLTTLQTDGYGELTVD